MERVILHCDQNCFFASVELLSHPDLRDVPMAVCGDPASRHGAVATGSYNFTRSARVANAENMLILRDNPALTQAYARNWQRHRAEALRLDSLDDLPAKRGKQDGRESDR